MKFSVIFFLAFIAAVYSAPSQISDNNVGDIVNVAVKGNLVLDNTVDAFLASLTGQYKNDQRLDIQLPPLDDIIPGNGQKDSDLLKNLIEMLSKGQK